jgi:WXG100 family type VII secretion target
MLGARPIDRGCALPGFAVVPEELQAASAQLGEIAAQARSDLSRLAAEAQALLEGGWHGQAAFGFQRGWTQWLLGAVEVMDALEAMARLLGATGQGYVGAEDDSGRVLISVGGLL